MMTSIIVIKRGANSVMASTSRIGGSSSASTASSKSSSHHHCSSLFSKNRYQLQQQQQQQQQRRFYITKTEISMLRRGEGVLFRQRQQQQYQSMVFKRTTTTTTTTTASKSTTKPLTARQIIYKEVTSRPIEFVSIPCVAAFVGILTNWMGVKMLFYPIEYFGVNLKRWDDTPYGLFGWQGVVPTKTEIMAKRLVNIVTTKLLSLDEAFGRLGKFFFGLEVVSGVDFFRGHSV
jgi:hypothetical protein